MAHAFWIWSGIVQGCVLSGALSALALSPFLKDLEACIEQPGLGACADDLGAALTSAMAPWRTARVMKIAARIAPWILKASQCKRVRLLAAYTAEVATFITALLQSHMPQCFELDVVDELVSTGPLAEAQGTRRRRVNAAMLRRPPLAVAEG
ncbi:unnamed protein product, partial [Prorocentrum cordatum]